MVEKLGHWKWASLDKSGKVCKGSKNVLHQFCAGATVAQRKSVEKIDEKVKDPGFAPQPEQL
jgi:hypothetical protein